MDIIFASLDNISWSTVLFKLINCPLYTTLYCLWDLQYKQCTVSVKRPEVWYSKLCALMTDPFEVMIWTFWLQIGPRQANFVLITYLSPMQAAKVQASLRNCAVSPEPPLLTTSSESRGTFRQKARSLNDWVCAVKICHDGMLEDTNSFDAAQLMTSD